MNYKKQNVRSPLDFLKRGILIKFIFIFNVSFPSVSCVCPPFVIFSNHFIVLCYLHLGRYGRYLPCLVPLETLARLWVWQLSYQGAEGWQRPELASSDTVPQMHTSRLSGLCHSTKHLCSH